MSPSARGTVEFCREIVQATQDFAVCYKINSAFFEALGSRGWIALEDVRAGIPAEVPVILDAKRGDIGNTAAAYAKALFEGLDADAATVSPYLGWDALKPFLEYPGRGVLVLCKTSNPGSADLQELETNGTPLYLKVAAAALKQQARAEVGLVVGATQPQALRQVRRLDEDLIILAPGVGAQGASAGDAVKDGANSSGDNLLAAASRDILYASSDAGFAEQARKIAGEWAAETWRARTNSGSAT